MLSRLRAELGGAMNKLRAVRSLVLLACLVAAGLAAMTLLSTSEVQARHRSAT